MISKTLSQALSRSRCVIKARKLRRMRATLFRESRNGFDINGPLSIFTLRPGFAIYSFKKRGYAVREGRHFRIKQYSRVANVSAHLLDC